MTEEKPSQGTAGHESAYPRRGRRTWLKVLLYLVILICGIAIGSGGTLLLLRPKGFRPSRHSEEAPAAITARLRSQLDLTQEQAQKVEDILRKRLKSLEAVRREMEPRLLAEQEKIRSEVAEVLTPEQAEKWNAHIESMRRRWFRRPPPPPSLPLGRPERR